MSDENVCSKPYDTTAGVRRKHRAWAPDEIVRSEQQFSQVSDCKLGASAVKLGTRLCSIIAGGVAALLLLLLRRAGRKSAFAYGPYLALGAVIVLGRSLLG